ncbi:MAG: recombination regulator RecX [Burkholderiaceae bacterium]
MNSPVEPLSLAALRVRAIAALTRREFSRSELFKKLSPLAASPEHVNQVLDGLIQEGLLSDERFAGSVSRLRGAKYGTARVRYELQQKGISGDTLDAAVKQLKVTESERLEAVWERKFGNPPLEPAESARQQRFLAQRGFTTESIGQLFRRLRSR